MDEKDNQSRERLLRPAEVARILSVSISLVYELLHSREIPVVQFGKTVRIRPADLDEFLKNSRKAKEGAPNE